MGVWLQLPKDLRRQLFDQDGAAADTNSIRVDACVLEMPARTKYVRDQSYVRLLVPDSDTSAMVSDRLHTMFNLTIWEALEVVEANVLPPVAGAVPEYVKLYDFKEANIAWKSNLWQNAFRSDHIDLPDYGQPDTLIVTASPSLHRGVLLAMYAF